MEELEQRVWQRVLGPAEEASGNIKALLLESGMLAAGYASLAKKAGETTGPLLKKLYREELEILHSLQGIAHLQGQPISLGHLAAPREPAARLLEKSYHRCRRAEQEYMARSVSGEFAQVFRELSERAGQQCCRITRLLGMLAKKSGQEIRKL